MNTDTPHGHDLDPAGAVLAALSPAHRSLSAVIDRELRAACGLSLAEADVLATLTRGPDGRQRMADIPGQTPGSKSRVTPTTRRPPAARPPPTPAPRPPGPPTPAAAPAPARGAAPPGGPPPGRQPPPAGPPPPACRSCRPPAPGAPPAAAPTAPSSGGRWPSATPTPL